MCRSRLWNDASTSRAIPIGRRNLVSSVYYILNGTAYSIASFVSHVRVDFSIGKALRALPKSTFVSEILFVVVSFTDRNIFFHNIVFDSGTTYSF